MISFFSKLHPTVLFLYFFMSVAAVMSFNNPVISALSLICASACTVVLFGRQALGRLGFSVIIIAVVSAFNFLFAHYGNDVLFTFKNTDFTLEALFFGFNQGMVISAALLWFTAMGKCVDSEKLVYLFRFAPKIALMLSMILGFIPRFLKKQKEIREARLALNGGEASKGVKGKMSAAVNDLSALTNYALEGSIITANSMTARGYNPRVIRGGRYRFKTDDFVFLFVSASLFAFVLVQKVIGNLSFVFEPDIYIKRLSVPAAVCFFIFGLMPVVTDLWRTFSWKRSRSAA